MKLSYLIPETSYHFFREIILHLEDAGVEVYTNQIHANTDIVLASILPITHEWYTRLFPLVTYKPIILWHWDMYSFTDYSRLHWRQFLELLPQVDEVWSCSYETARELKEKMELDSFIVPAWVNSRALGTAEEVGNSIFFASGGGSIGKRTDWLSRASTILNIPLHVVNNQRLSRPDYLRVLNDCRAYVMPAFEESNATIPAMEAAVVGKPVILADIPSNREVFGNTGVYFKPWDFKDFLDVIEYTFNAPESTLPENARERIIRNYDINVVVPKILERLHACVTSWTR